MIISKIYKIISILIIASISVFSTVSCCINLESFLKPDSPEVKIEEEDVPEVIDNVPEKIADDSKPQEEELALKEDKEDEDTPVTAEENKTITALEKVIEEENSEKNYEISAFYPEIGGLADEEKQLAINEEIEKLIIYDIDLFKYSIDGWDTEGFPELEDIKSIMGTSYGISLMTDDVISIMFYVYEYYSGAAHGLERTQAFNFDFSSGDYIMLEDLFEPDFNYLDFLSCYCVKELKEGPVETWENIEESGAGPDVNSFKSFVLTEDSIVIFFDPYIVACYAEGIVEVIIPYSEFRDHINPDGPIPLVSE
jgi:hypothetical protein